MLERTTAGALCGIAAALALIALASAPRSAPAAAPPLPKRPRSAAPSTPAAVSALREGQRLDLNSARAGDLELLPGIGPGLAQRIVADRDAHGRFANLEALLRVRGVGPRTLERLRGTLAVDDAQGRALDLSAGTSTSP